LRPCESWEQTYPCQRSLMQRAACTACVEFLEHNLAVLPYPERLREFDLILCRNVLMYFSMDTAARITRELSKCLCEGGYLVLDSWVSPLDLHLDDCGVVQCEYGIVIEKTGRRRLPTQARTSAQSASQSQIPTPDRTQSRPQAYASAQPSAHIRLYGQEVAATAQVSASPDATREHEDGGQPQWPHQPHLLESLRQETPFDARVHRLMGEIHLQLSDPRAASYCFSRLIYLDPGDPVAHWRMADACEQMGRHDDELRHLCCALECLEDSGSVRQLELPSDVLVKACLHRIGRLRLRQRI